MELRECKTLVVFGGTFDPPHKAHVELPELAMRSIGADAVAYVPAAISPLKLDQAPTPARHRLAMLRLALADVAHAVVLSEELDRHRDDCPSYTVDTLERLRRGLDKDVTLRLLIGADQLRVFDQWRSHGRIVRLAEPLVMIRPPDTRESLLTSLPTNFDADVWARRLIDLPLIDISSSDLRDRVANGQSITGLVAPDVEEYISRHSLYRQSC